MFEMFLYLLAIVFLFWLTSKPKKVAGTEPFGVDYTRLRNLLILEKWRQADLETADIMLNIAEREKEQWLDIPDIENFPCSELCTIDQLWVKYSNGRFGFSVQKCIWQSMGGTPNADWETWCRFGELVGWYVNGSWFLWNDANFTLSAPVGHLPRRGAFIHWANGDFWTNCRILSTLASRIETCNIALIEQEAISQLMKDFAISHPTALFIYNSKTIPDDASQYPTDTPVKDLVNIKMKTMGLNEEDADFLVKSQLVDFVGATIPETMQPMPDPCYLHGSPWRD